jgi:hypothetical protein
MVINSLFYQFFVLSIRCSINSLCYQFGERSICCSIKSLHFSVVFIKPVFNESGYRYFLKSILATVSEPRFLWARTVTRIGAALPANVEKRRTPIKGVCCARVAGFTLF